MATINEQHILNATAADIDAQKFARSKGTHSTVSSLHDDANDRSSTGSKSTETTVSPDDIAVGHEQKGGSSGSRDRVSKGEDGVRKGSQKHTSSASKRSVEIAAGSSSQPDIMSFAETKCFFAICATFGALFLVLLLTPRSIAEGPLSQSHPDLTTVILRLKNYLTDLSFVSNLAISVVGFHVTLRVIPKFEAQFIKAGLCGVDLSKRTTKRDADGKLVRPVEVSLNYLNNSHVRLSGNLFLEFHIVKHRHSSGYQASRSHRCPLWLRLRVLHLHLPPLRLPLHRAHIKST